jgi:hypothetical protein
MLAVRLSFTQAPHLQMLKLRYLETQYWLLTHCRHSHALALLSVLAPFLT